MKKGLFLEHKFGDYDLEALRQSGANELIVWLEELTPKRWQKLRNLGIELEIALGAFDHDFCPLDPESKLKLGQKIKRALVFDPRIVWLDHFRFGGYWEGIKNGQIPDLHLECRWCRGKDRAVKLAQIAKWLKSQIPKGVELGYFAVPFRAEEEPLLISSLGQDHRLLGGFFDVISPMLYHRMVKKPVDYISEYVDYLHRLTKKPILPIIQVKDMPDDLPDEFDQKEMKLAFQSGARPPSEGVAWFSWNAAIEKGKTQIIEEIFTAH